MKILWIVNSVFGKHFELLGMGNIPFNSGGWYSAAYDSLKEEKDVELHIVGLSPKVTDIVYTHDDYNNVFYLLPGATTTNDQSFDSPRNQRLWRQIREIVKPDIVQLWGTEYQHGLCALMQLQGIPQVVYIQGVLSEIARYYLAGIDRSVYRKHYTLRNFIKQDSSIRVQKHFFKRAQYEKKILQLAKSVIVENDWCEGICRGIIGKDAQVFRSMLPINDVFFHHDWDSGKMEPFSIFTNAGGYNIKGHHFLFEALSIVIEKYPDVKVYIPGGTTLTRTGWKNNLKQKDYEHYLASLIQEYHLAPHIVWMGVMAQDDMAAQLAKSHIYVMPSAIENHSSSLIEAMIVGTPCVSSFVGGVNDFSLNKENILLYRSDDVITLAANICRLFEDMTLCKHLSEGAKKMRTLRATNRIHEDFGVIYASLLDKE